MRRLFVDTFYLIALSSPRDQWHQRVVMIVNHRLTIASILSMKYWRNFSPFAAPLERKLEQRPRAWSGMP